MAMETVEARYLEKNEAGETMLDEDGKPVYIAASAEYDFGDDLDSAVALCGAETVHSNYRANAKVALQGIVRAKKKAGHTDEEIQSVVTRWKPGMVAEKSTIDPAVAFEQMFKSSSPEKRAELLARLGIVTE